MKMQKALDRIKIIKFWQLHQKVHLNIDLKQVLTQNWVSQRNPVFNPVHPHMSISLFTVEQSYNIFLDDEVLAIMFWLRNDFFRPVLILTSMFRSIDDSVHIATCDVKAVVYRAKHARQYEHRSEKVIPKSKHDGAHLIVKEKTVRLLDCK